MVAARPAAMEPSAAIGSYGSSGRWLRLGAKVYAIATAARAATPAVRSDAQYIRRPLVPAVRARVGVTQLRADAPEFLGVGVRIDRWIGGHLGDHADGVTGKGSRSEYGSGMGSLHCLTHTCIKGRAKRLTGAIEQRAVGVAAGQRAKARRDADPGPRICDNGLDVVGAQNLIARIVLERLGVVDHFVAQMIAGRIVVADGRLLKLVLRAVRIDMMEARYPRIRPERLDRQKPFHAEKTGQQYGCDDNGETRCAHGRGSLFRGVHTRAGVKAKALHRSRVPQVRVDGL